MTIKDRSAPMLLVRLQTPTDEYRVVTDSILSFSYTDAERKTDTVKLTVDNSDLSQFDDPAWRKGGKIRVSWGYPQAMAPERTCVITSVKGFRELEIEANGLDVLFNTIQRQRVFEGVKISDIASQIAGEYGYGSEVRFIDDTEEVRDIVTQANLTDAQFLRQHASESGFEFYVDFDGFHFHERRLGERPVRVLTYFIDQNQGDFIGDPTIENDLTARPGRVRARGRNPRTRQDVSATASNTTDTNRHTLTEVVEVIDPESGSATNVEREVAQETTTQTAASNDTRATRRARGRFRRAQQVAVKMSATIIGDPTLLAKTIVQIEGMGQRLSVKYYVSEVTHNLSPSGYECALKLVSDGHGGHSTTSRQVDGLSMIGVQQARNNRGQNDDMNNRLTQALESASRSGDEDSVRALESAKRAYQRGGNANRDEVVRALNQVARNTNASSDTRRQAAEARGALSQSGSGEVASGGRPNRQSPDSNANDRTEPIEIINPEDQSSTLVQYQQAPTRGRNSRSTN